MTVMQQHIGITHATDIAAARRAGVQMANALGFEETQAGKLAIAITEAATNVLKHAGSGQVLIGPAPLCPGAIDVLALDSGPGIRNIARSMQDGVSTAGTPGNGLGAMRRLVDGFDVYSAPEKGTAVFMRIGTGAMETGVLEAGAACVPLAGEDECGDGWSMVADARGANLLMSDGLGHGQEAARATDAALSVFASRYTLAPVALIEAAHIALRSTRGAALAAARLDLDTNTAHFAGIGNISAMVCSGGVCKQLMSHNGIVGHNMRKVQEVSIPWPADVLFVMHSDGLSRQWEFSRYPGLELCHPALIAGVLYRDFARGRDDATIAVVRRRREG